jgi:hypothetical protein
MHHVEKHLLILTFLPGGCEAAGGQIAEVLGGQRIGEFPQTGFEAADKFIQ